jgi:hypothetical protein
VVVGVGSGVVAGSSAYAGESERSR